MDNDKNKLYNWLEIIFKMASIIGVVVLFWYTVETYKIRKNSDEQLIMSVRPYIAFLQDANPYTITNISNNVAQNIVQISKLSGQYYISGEESVGGLGPNGQRNINKDNSKLITSDELKKKLPSIVNLINYLDGKRVNCLVVVYDDLLGNKLFSVFYGSGDAFEKGSETRYINEL